MLGKAVETMTEPERAIVAIRESENTLRLVWADERADFEK